MPALLVKTGRALLAGSGQYANAGGGDVTPPTLVSATVDAAGTTLTLVFSEAVVNVAHADWSTAAVHALSNTGGSGTTWTMTIAQVYQGENLTITYTPGTTEDLAGNDLAAILGAAVTNNSTVLADGTLVVGLEEYWPLDEASGNRTGAHAGLILTDNNTIGSAAGVGGVGTAALFVRANSEWGERADVAALSFADEHLSGSVWVYLNDNAVSQTILGKWDSSTPNKEYHLHYLTGTGFRFQVSSDGTGQTSVTASNFGIAPTGQWIHLGFYHDPVSNRIGIRANYGTWNTAAHTTGCRDSDEPFRVGKFDGGDHLDARLAGLGLWRRKLNDLEWELLADDYLSYEELRTASPGEFAPDLLYPAIWLAADRGTFQSAGGSAATADGDPVGQWQDQTGFGLHGAQTNASWKPTLKLNIINGLPTVRLDGTDDQFEIAGVSPGNDVTLCFVLKPGSTTPLGFFDSAPSAAGTLRNFNSGHFQHQGGTPDFDLALANTNPVLLTLTLNKTGNTSTLHKNGSLVDTQTMPTNPAWGATPRMGSINNGGAGWYSGDYAEVLIFPSVLSAGNRGLVETYLMTRWGL